MVGQAVRAQIEELRETGFVVVPRFVAADPLAQLNRIAREQLAARAAPLEFEADLRYPGAPKSQRAAGGHTIRRLLDAYERSPALAHFAVAQPVREWMEAYFEESAVVSRAHHNCVMTKHPRYGSMTGWHRDIRFWSFAREDLVSVWLALGEETAHNGALWLVPGSQRMTFDAERFDTAKFFRTDRSDNVRVADSAVALTLGPGDAVFFHCNTLHSAGSNKSDRVKFALVYTYHGRSNAPVPGTRSASKPEVALAPSVSAT